MSRQSSRVSGLLTSQGHSGSYDAFLVEDGEVATGDDHLGEDHSRVRGERADVDLLPAMYGGLDPLCRDHWDHVRLGLRELLETDGVGNDVRHLFDW